VTDTSQLATYARAYIDDTRRRCAIDAMFSTVDALSYAATAEGLRRGPVAKSGARSHVLWRSMLAARFDTAALAVASAAAQYAEIANPGPADHRRDAGDIDGDTIPDTGAIGGLPATIIRDDEERSP